MWNFCCAALLVTLAATSAAALERSYTGAAVIRTISPTRVAVFLDSNGDETVDNGFLLTTDIPMNAMAIRFGSATVSFTDGYVRLASGSRVYDLQVAGYPDSPATPKEKDVMTLIGSALQHSKGDSGCNIERAHGGDAGGCYSYGSE